MVVDSGVHPSLHPYCHHQIIYCRCNLSIEYSPPSERLVWNYIKMLRQNQLNKVLYWQIGTIYFLMNMSISMCYFESATPRGANFCFALCKLQNVFSELRSNFVRFSKFCKAEIFGFQNNIFYRYTGLAVCWIISSLKNFYLIYKEAF